eukprot:UN28273
MLASLKLCIFTCLSVNFHFFFIFCFRFFPWRSQMEHELFHLFFPSKH